MTTCSARPAELERFALGGFAESERVLVATGPLTDALDEFARVNSEFGTLHRADSDATVATGSLSRLADWVRLVGEAFAAADGRELAQPDSGVVDSLLFNSTWSPRDNVFQGSHARWEKDVYGGLDFFRRCVARDFGYQGAGSNVGGGFITGPDGRRYPLVAPHVTRDGVRYNDDNGGAGGGGGVWELDGRDPGWVTTQIRSGVERFRGEPSTVERLLGAAGCATVTCSPKSTDDQVKAVVMRPGAMPSIGEVSHAPVHPGMPTGGGTEPPTPKARAVASVVDLIAPASEALLAFVLADQGAHRAYQVVFQRNQLDGRIRAIYTTVRVAPPSAAEDAFVLTPERVLGPDVNGIEPTEMVVYAPSPTAAPPSDGTAPYRVNQPG